MYLPAIFLPCLYLIAVKNFNCNVEIALSKCTCETEDFFRDQPADASKEHNCIPDEHYVQTLLAVRYYPLTIMSLVDSDKTCMRVISENHCSTLSSLYFWFEV